MVRAMRGAACTVSLAVAVLLLAAQVKVALSKDLFLSAWSYSPYPGWGSEPMGTPPMWGVDDWIAVDAHGKATPWVTTILATPSSGANQSVRCVIFTHSTVRCMCRLHAAAD